MKVKDLPMINYVERTINEIVIDEVEKGLLNEEVPKIIKLPVDDLLGDTITERVGSAAPVTRMAWYT